MNPDINNDSTTRALAVAENTVIKASSWIITHKIG